MKINHFLGFLPFILALNLCAQSSIKGEIIDSSNAEKIVPNAVLITNQQRYFFSDNQGKFSIELRKGEIIDKVVSRGYKPLMSFDAFSVLKMTPAKADNLERVSRHKIDSIVRHQVISSHFSFKSLSRTSISNAVPDFILRKAAEVRLTTQEGFQENLKAVSVNGLEEVVPKLVNKDVYSFDWFQSYIEIFDYRFVSPFHSLDTPLYEFYSLYETPEVKILSFRPLKKGFLRSFQGLVIIDKSTSKFKKLQVVLDGEFKLNLVTDYDSVTGLPKKTEAFIYPGTGGTKLSFFGGGMAFGRIQKKNPEGNDAQLTHQQVYYDVVTGDSISPYPKPFTKIYEPKPGEIPEEYWSDFEFAFIADQKETSEQLEAYIQEENIGKKVNRISAFDQGYYPISIFDVDLTRLFKFNNYEGLRLGAGVITNESFSEHYRLGGFAAYGFKDERWKYGFNGGLLLNPDTSTWFNAFYDNDIEEVGMNNFLTDQRVYSLFEPRLVNITFFYKYETYGLSLQHNFTPQLMTEFKVDKSSISQTQQYAFLKDGILYEDYDLTTATFGLRWTPNYTYSKVGKRVYVNDKSSPEISAQVSQSFDGVMEGDFSFTKLSAKVEYEIPHSWGSLSSIELGGDIGFGDIPLTHSFHAFPNSPNKPNVLSRFSVAGVKSFETMFFNEFFSTKLATLHLKHKLAAFQLSNTIQPELIFISRHAIGDFDNPGQHQNISFNSLSKGYNEAGFELNKLFFGFGLSFAYRYGAYHLPKLEDNVSLKFTFYLKL
ncbi:hypothetical protein G3567_11100 [Psychroflexus sp. YR1-1]|uniref:CarboxypepD_reg-like domain-containing protein n=1 Tax=Psychroflexus aurantiacus TaxID=2709310 RepID=A0A6B3R565_9FLAO|nr:DUF5686 family protein [Psychroflexus aurantiacus]NEV94690.1 hypothetical protein [Psychroflexus aurantiacus]